MAYIGSGPTRFNTADDLTVTDDAEIGGDLTVTGSADINGGTIDGVTIGGSSAPTVTDIDINGGTIDGVTIGGASAGAGTFTGLTVGDGHTIGDDSFDNLKILGSDGEIVVLESTNRRVDIRDSDALLATFEAGGDISFYEDTGTTPKLFWDASAESLGIGGASPAGTAFTVTNAGAEGLEIRPTGGLSGGTSITAFNRSGSAFIPQTYNASEHIFVNSGSSNEKMRIDSSGHLLVGTTSIQPADNNTAGHYFENSGQYQLTCNGARVIVANRKSNDGAIVEFRQDGTAEGSISVSGTTVSYNGGHLARWSQTADDLRIDGLVKGTVLSNLDEMCEWRRVEFDYQHLVSEAVEAQDEVLDEEGNVVQEAVEATVILEDNEQLNRMKVSDVEGDPNVAGVFVNWDDDDDVNTADMNIAMTGDMVIRIAQGTTVARGDLLMSAGDGTAKPQDDDIVRSKTIAKVTSTHVSHTYDDGSYLVPCVLMAC